MLESMHIYRSLKIVPAEEFPNIRIAHPKLKDVTRWARHDDAIRALVVTGSLSRDDGASDQFSDLDVQIITRDLELYTADDDWLDRLGEVWIRFPLRQDSPYRLVWFRGGIKVDFQFVRLREFKTQLTQGALPDEYQRGYRVLLDKDQLFRHLPPSPRVFPRQPLPTAAAVQEAINEFWFEAIHVAQFIRRREYWVVKHRDWTMKTNLLRLLEWHARLTGEEPVNTWLLGRRISCWADDEAYDAVKGIWGNWEAQSLWDALFVQLGLFRRLSTDLLQALGNEYDDKNHREINDYIRQLFQEDSEAGFTG